MKARLARLGVLITATLGLLAGMTPSAEATTVGAIAVVGTATTAPGLGYFCVGSGPTPSVDPKKCPVVEAVVNGEPLPGGLIDPVPGNGVMLPNKSKPAHPWLDGGNTVGVTFTGDGAGALIKVAKPKCAGVCVEAGTFSITDLGGGFVTGWCGLSWGKVNSLVSPLIAAGTKMNTRTANVNFVGVGGLLVVTGKTSNDEWLSGAVLATPNTAAGSSCTNKGAKTFIVAGMLYLGNN